MSRTKGVSDEALDRCQVRLPSRIVAHSRGSVIALLITFALEPRLTPKSSVLRRVFDDRGRMHCQNAILLIREFSRFGTVRAVRRRIRGRRVKTDG